MADLAVGLSEHVEGQPAIRPLAVGASVLCEVTLSLRDARSDRRHTTIVFPTVPGAAVVKPLNALVPFRATVRALFMGFACFERATGGALLPGVPASRSGA